VQQGSDPPLRLRDRAAYFPATDAVVVADLHVGRGGASRVQLPTGERGDLLERTAATLAAFDPAEFVVAGDAVHAFDGPDRRTLETLDDLAAACRDAGARPVVVAGNHDAALDDAWDGRVREHYRLDADTVVCHGHAVPEVDAERYVVGHDHPAVEIEGQRHPCALYGADQRRGRTVAMLPAFTRLASGVVVNRRSAAEFDSPLVTDADALRPLVADGDGGTLSFPPLGAFRSML